MLIVDDTGTIDSLTASEIGGLKLWKEPLIGKDAYIIEVCMKEDRKAVMTQEYTFYSEEKAQHYFKLIFDNMDDKEGKWLNS